MKSLSFVLLLSSALLCGTLSARPTAEVDGKSYPVYTPKDGMRPVGTNKLVYPPAAMKEGRGGTVEVGVLVDEHGKTSKPYVAKSDAAKDLQQAALNSMEGCRLPVIKDNDRPISYVYVVPIAFSVDSTADKPAVGPQGLTLEVVISDAKYLKQILRPKTVISPIDRVAEIPPEVTKAIKDANLSEVTQLFPLPAGATPLKRDKMIAPKYPDDLRRHGVSGQASFLLYVGADGKVLGLYCYQTSYPAFAVASAQVMLSWKFKPAKIGDVAIPVLTAQLMTFETN